LTIYQIHTNVHTNEYISKCATCFIQVVSRTKSGGMGVFLKLQLQGRNSQT